MTVIQTDVETLIFIFICFVWIYIIRLAVWCYKDYIEVISHGEARKNIFSFKGKQKQKEPNPGE